MAAGHEKEKKIVVNTAYTIGGSLLLNGVLQLAVYPLLYARMGGSQLGVLLYIMGLVAILCPSVGQSLNTGRLVVRREYEVSNGDYDSLLLLFGGAGSLICLLLSYFLAPDSIQSLPAILLTVLLLMATSFRYYGDVEYRLNLNYRRYFIYYAVVSAGYLAGYVLYCLTDCWYLIFLTGELLSLVWLKATGKVFDGFLTRSRYFPVALKRGGFLVFSYLVTNLTMNIDRLVLKSLISDLAVTQYYVASLIGKTLVMLVAPVNTVLISYLTKSKTNMNRKQFFLFSGAGLGVAAVFFLCAQVATPIFIRLMYGDLYEAVKPMIAVVNLSQVLSMLSAYLFMVVLTFTGEKWQLALQLAHLALLMVLVLLFTGSHGIMGFAAAVLAANALRVAAVLLLGVVKVRG